MKSLIIYLLLAFTCSTVLAQERCRTNTGVSGHCVPYKSCNMLDTLVRSYDGNVPPKVRQYILDLQCNKHLPDVHICCNDVDLSSSDDSEGFKILNSLKCGDSSVNRVLNGNKTHLREFPWMALLRYDSAKFPFQCGGSLITNRYILTAAHCVKETEDKLIGVRLGEYDIDSNEDCERKGRLMNCNPPVEDFDVVKIIPHENYKKAKYINDIALVQLDREVEFKPHIKAICLPITEASLQNQPTDYFIAGWGSTEKGSVSKVLLKAQLKHQDSNYCQSIFTRVRVFEQHLCAGGAGNADSCRGDSGGPLFSTARYKNAPRAIQFGIVSFGVEGCNDLGDKAYPGFYTNVKNFLPWIMNNIS